ncbi:oxidoreductase [Sphingomonas sp. Root710]|uniref:SDR family NAD(P)-dependent oxidoreductase n=1 Tax=Sphingomonas sp. Root710 TaxID=1736594 RepID=UPI0006FBECC3|nr:SDR family NAD(P)-dependent oxidoreductase [Sphingomonas sp. Root710]KRB85370.1 oxidoreductase [Sphingomonas sp. Root710]
MAGRLKDKVCVITGSGGSMGRAAARMFAAEGAIVVGCDIDEASANETERLVREAGGAIRTFHPGDLSRKEVAEALAEWTLAQHGRIDVLYNNGGGVVMEWLQKMTADQWSFTMRNELDLIFFATQAVWPAMVAQKSGSIINVGSVSGKIAYRVLPAVAHSAAKGGVIAMTKHLAMEGGPHGIRVNSISPGLVETNATRALLDIPEWAEAMHGKLMLGHVGQPEDVVYAALYLASDEARWVTGADFAIDGGTTAW